MNRIFGIGVVFFISLMYAGCGFYSFSGSTLPSNLKTIDIPLFVNESTQPGVAEDITQQLGQRVLSLGQLRLVSSNGDATIQGRITGYSNYPKTYSRETDRQVDVSEYAVRITADVVFMDNKRNEPIFKGPVSGEGLYNFKTGREEEGRAKAVTAILDQILQNSVSSW